MIALVQMLGTARRVRDAIGQLRVPVPRDKSLEARVLRVLRHDFVPVVPKGQQGQLSRRCESAVQCSVFTEGEIIRKPLQFGVQNDPEEALHHVFNAWRNLDGSSSVRGRAGFNALGSTQMHQLFSVVTEWRRVFF